MADHMGGAVSAVTSDGQEAPLLPPGFRFHPTDEELVGFYLAKKIQNPNFWDHAISEADLNKCEPWELPGKARMGEKEWYFYSLKDRKYPTGVRTNRATQAGYWKATGKDREVMGSQGTLKGKLIGMKKTLVFYQGRAPKGTKSNWVMHEYRAEDDLKHSLKCKISKDEWVLCRVFHKTSGGKKMALIDLQIAAALIGGSASHKMDVQIATVAATLPGLREVPWNTPTTQASLSWSHMSGQNMANSSFGPVQTYLSGQAAVGSYMSGHGEGVNLPAHGAVGSHAYGPTTGQASQNKLANLLNSLPETGNSAWKSLFQQYNDQVNYVKVERKDDGQVPALEELDMIEQRSMDVQMPVTTWGVVGGNQNLSTLGPCGRPPSPESCISTFECGQSNYANIPIARLPSDLESLWLYADH